MSKNILVAYASVSGSTGEVAKAIGETLTEAGANVTVQDAKEVSSLSGYHALVLGSSIRAGRWLPKMMNLIDDIKDDMAQIPVAYFTTCLTMINESEESRRTVLAYMEPVLQKAPDVEPISLGMFAGSLDPDRMRTGESSASGPQGDYRNWDAIKAWATEIAPALLGSDNAPIIEEDQTLIMRDATLSYTDMAHLDLSGADLAGSDLSESDLTAANLHRAAMSEAKLERAKLDRADLFEADLNWAEMSGAQMSEANLSQANLIGAHMDKANLMGANLSRAILNGAILNGANLSGANLSNTDLNWADMRGADLSGADLSGASLGWANCSDATLKGVNMSGAHYNDQTQWPEGFSPEAHGAIAITHA